MLLNKFPKLSVGGSTHYLITRDDGLLQIKISEKTNNLKSADLIHGHTRKFIDA